MLLRAALEVERLTLEVLETECQSSYYLYQTIYCCLCQAIKLTVASKACFWSPAVSARSVPVLFTSLPQDGLVPQPLLFFPHRRGHAAPHSYQQDVWPISHSSRSHHPLQSFLRAHSLLSWATLSTHAHPYELYPQAHWSACQVASLNLAFRQINLLIFGFQTIRGHFFNPTLPFGPKYYWSQRFPWSFSLVA